jgi:hypothetical protein
LIGKTQEEKQLEMERMPIAILRSEVVLREYELWKRYEKPEIEQRLAEIESRLAEKK